MKCLIFIFKEYLPGNIFEFDYFDELRKFDSQYLGHTHSEIIRNIKLVFRCDEEDIIDFQKCKRRNDQHILYIQD